MWGILESVSTSHCSELILLPFPMYIHEKSLHVCFFVDLHLPLLIGIPFRPGKLFTFSLGSSTMTAVFLKPVFIRRSTICNRLRETEYNKTYCWLTDPSGRKFICPLFLQIESDMSSQGIFITTYKNQAVKYL